MISHHTALIYTMVLVSAADRRMPDAELRKIGEILGTLPVFEGYDSERPDRTPPPLAPNCWTTRTASTRPSPLIEAALPPEAARNRIRRSPATSPLPTRR